MSDVALIVYATRYALGRSTSAAADVCGAIRANRDEIIRDAGSCQALVRDIGGWLGHFPDGPYAREWTKAVESLREAAS